MNKNFYIILTAIIFSNLAVGANQALEENAAQARNPYFDLAAFLAGSPEKVIPEFQNPEDQYLSIPILRKKRKLPIPTPDLRGNGNSNYKVKKKTEKQIAAQIAYQKEKNLFALYIQHGLTYTCSTGESGKCYPTEINSREWSRWTRRPFVLEKEHLRINDAAKTNHGVVPPAIGLHVTLVPSAKGRSDVIFELASSEQIPFHQCPILKQPRQPSVSLFDYPLPNQQLIPRKKPELKLSERLPQ